MATPFGVSNPFDDNDPFGLKAAHARQAWRRPATPEQTESVGKQALNLGLSGLAYVGSSLDKPGRAVRGLLGGKPHELLAALPLSDTLNITKPEDAVSGADLNRKYFGVKNDNSWKSWGLGLGTEIATNPFTYTSFGTGSALTKAGQTANKAGLLRGLTRAQRVKGFDLGEDAMKAAGKTAEDIAHAGRQGKTIAPAGSGIAAQTPLSGLMKIGLPGTGRGLVLGTGKTGQAVAGFADKAADFAKYKIPGMKTASALFDKNVQRANTEEMQRGMRAVGTPAREALGQQGRELHYNVTSQIQNLIKQGETSGAWTEKDLLRALRMHSENVVPSNALPSGHNVFTAAAPLGRQLRQLGKTWLADARAMGVPQGELADDYIDYFMRQATKSAPGKIQAGSSSLTPLGHGSQIRRKDWLRDVPGGTEMFNKWIADPALSGPQRTLRPQQVRSAVLADMLDQFRATGMQPNQAVIQKLEKKAAQASRTLAKMKPEYAASQKPFFSPDMATATELRAARQGKVMGSGHAIYGTIGESARKLDPDMVPVSALAGKGGLPLRTYGEGADPVQGFLVESHKALAKQGAPMTEQVMRDAVAAANAAGKPQEAAEWVKAALKADVDRYGFTPEQLANMTRDYGRWTAPEEVGGVLRGFDPFTTMFRNMAYSTWLPSHVRNLMGGLVQSAATTGTSPTALGAARRVIGNKATAAEIAGLHPGLPAGLTDQAANEWLRGQAYAHGKIFSGFNAAETLQPGQVGHRITPALPGSESTPNMLGEYWQGLKGTGKELLGWARHPIQNPLRQGGPLEQVGVGAGQRNFPLLESGRKVGSEVENELRLAQYLNLTKRGYAPAEAGRQVLRTHFDYGGLTPFERAVGRRAIPFYTFASRNLPLQMQTMLTRPGVTNAQLKLAAGQGDQSIPQYLASGVAIPTGPEQDGKRQFISQLGIPIEEAFERLKMVPGDPGASVKNTLMAYMAGFNPLIKGPLEQLFNKQFFSGRDLSDLRPQGTIGTLGSLLDPDTRHPGVTQLAAQALANTPATRFLTTIDKAMDPRKTLLAKGLNLLTGVRVSDVDMDKARAIESRRMIESLLRSSPAVSEHRELYVRPEDQAKLTPADVERLQALSRLRSEAQAAAKKRAVPPSF